MDDYDCRMQRHPLDAELRERIRKSGVSETELARATGCNQSWLHKYANGSGHATIDDAVRILAILIGLETQPLSVLERRLLKAWRQTAEDRQEDAVAVFENIAKGYRRALPQESTGRVARKTQATSSRAREKP